MYVERFLLETFSLMLVGSQHRCIVDRGVSRVAVIVFDSSQQIEVVVVFVHVLTYLRLFIRLIEVLALIKGRALRFVC